MRLTERDRQIVELVFRAGALREDQVRVALFSSGAASRCQLRLTLLVRHHYLDRLPRPSANDPAVYVLSRRSVEGNRLLRERFGEGDFRQQRRRLGALAHLLAVNDLRVRIERACHNLGWSLLIWHAPEELARLLAGTHLVPDAYFKVQRPIDGGVRTAAFFLEMERVSKSSRVLVGKLQRYRDLYYGGRYEQLFGTKALRVLFVFATPDGSVTTLRVRAGVEEASRLGVTVARFAGLDLLKERPPSACLMEPVWHEPTSPRAVALFGNSSVVASPSRAEAVRGDADTKAERPGADDLRGPRVRAI